MAVVQHLLRKIENFIEEHPSKNELVRHKHRLTDLPEKDGNEAGKGAGGIKCLHKSCKLPREIHRWFHNRHPLILQHSNPNPPTKKPLKKKVHIYLKLTQNIFG
ncbi:hypothetical protein HYC85_014153 [Camellia sinensis]|uniref:Uncharacterized protein n=1 Tax=Camellia sinensis TaxID=4442 RepID=A0A7J7H8Y1_CAMSI|nr:hypothetical protein HYC85_014153 [Camellia sinensis]